MIHYIKNKKSLKFEQKKLQIILLLSGFFNKKIYEQLLYIKYYFGLFFVLDSPLLNRFLVTDHKSIP